MAEKQAIKPEIAPQKKVIKFAPLIGDWTVYKPPRVLVKKVKTGLYGFDRLSKNELNQVLIIHYNFIKELMKRLKIDLGMGVELYSVSVEQTTYYNFLRGVNSQVVQGKIVFPGTHDNADLFIDLAQANSIINYALGSRDLEPISRALTETENNLFTATMNEYLKLYAAAFEGALKDPAYKTVSSPDMTVDTSINPSLTLASFSAELALADNPPGKIVFAYSGNMLKALLSSYREKSRARTMNIARLSSSLLSKITAPLSVDLGETQLTTNDIGQLEVGDVVSLDTMIDAPLTLTTGDGFRSYVQPVIKHKKVAVRLVGFEENEELAVPKPELSPSGAEEAPLPIEEAPKPIRIREEEELGEDEEGIEGKKGEEEFEEFPEEEKEEEFEEFPEEEELEEEEEKEGEEGKEEKEGEEEDFEEFPEEDEEEEEEFPEEEEEEEEKEEK